MNVLIGILVLFCVLLSQAVGQELKTIPPPTKDEELQYVKADDRRVTTFNELQQTTFYQRAVAAANELNLIKAKMFETRKLKETEAILCFGPSIGLCADVPEQTLQFKAVPKEKK